MKRGKYILANAVCTKCGTTKENPDTAFCINGHDSWLESKDYMELFEQASKDLNTTMAGLIHAINTNTDIII